MSTKTNTAGNQFLQRVYDVQNSDDCKQIYDDWADQFDSDLTDSSQDYVGHILTAQAVLAASGNVEGTVLDAGCGTGLSGVALSKAGAKTIDGVDLSTGMLKVARKTGVYRDLAEVNLQKPIDKADGLYDVVTCVGTLTHGHVGPVPALREFVRISKAGGVIAATVLDDIWVSGGYEAEVERLRNEGLVEVISTDTADYRKGAGVKARMLVMKRK